jgi:hypothetical protein
MTTGLSEIADLFLSRISDWKLDAVFTTSGSLAFGSYVEPWLFDSIVDFDVCTQDLTYTASTEDVEGVFTETLTLENKVILSQLMVLGWLSNNIQNVLQMQNFITDRDFKTFSAAQNLSARKDLYNTKREEVSQKLVDYGMRHNAWSEWKLGNFDGSG